MNIVRSVLKFNMIARALHSYYFRSCVNYHRLSDNVIMGRKVPVSSTNFNNNVQKTAVMIRLSSQRILSSSSSSPRRERKKSKTFTSPNRFADIASNETNGCSVSSRPQTPTMVMCKANILHSELKALLFFLRTRMHDKFIRIQWCSKQDYLWKWVFVYIGSMRSGISYCSTHRSLKLKQYHLIETE